MRNSHDIVMKDQIEQLYEEYHKNRDIQLSLDQFIYIANLFPALLVCMSDGKLDDDEWNGILRITDSLAQVYSSENGNDSLEDVAQIFRTEFRYLLDNSDKWNKKFLNALKDRIKENKSEKEFIAEAMYLFANASSGISAAEQQTINDLSKRLSLDF